MTVGQDRGVLWSRIADLPLEIEDYSLERLQRDVSSSFTRVSTVFRLRGGDGHEGLGEDVGYNADDQLALQEAGPVQPLAGSYTLESFCDHLETLDLWPEPARQEAAVLYRVWAYESAALDLALRQAGLSLQAALRRAARPLTFVVSLRLGEPATLAPLRARLDLYPATRFKLDPTQSWDDALVAQLVETGAVDTVDLKGLYAGSIVANAPDPALYRRVAEAFPDAWIEDPGITDETWPVLEPYQDRITWDANIHSVDDIVNLPFKPRMVNVKPSRLGGLRSLLKAYEYCEANDIMMYGGGQFELGVGRGHIQYLAAIFHPDGPNDVAPGGYNLVDPPEGLPTSPLPVLASETGFRWGTDAG
jgi:L-alanine-DL-glutamate epimerase-like enolase superfamily enzyme